MKIRMLISMAGADESYSPGEIREVSAEIGKAMCEDGRAEPVAVKKISKRETRKK